MGKNFAEELLKTGKHTVTAVTRAGSKADLPQGVQVTEVDYNDDGSSLVSALRGQQFLVITLSVRAPEDTHTKVVNAAAKAGVPYIMPNAYGADIQNKQLAEDNLIGKQYLANCAQVEKAGASYIAMVCGFWYQWSLSCGEPWFGFDIKNRKVTLYDDGKTKINVSTLRQCGRALAALLSLPESGATPALEQWKNKPFYFASFRLSQREMLDSVQRVTKTSDSDWTISYETTTERYKNGLEAMQKGDFTGFPKAMYARAFMHGDGDYEKTKTLCNGMFGLPKEDLDEETKVAVDLVESGWSVFEELGG